MENQTVMHITQNSRYRIVIERAASTKGTLGYKVEVNGDVLSQVKLDVQVLKQDAEIIAGLPILEKEK